MGTFTTTSTTFAVGDEYTASWQNTYVKGLIDGFGAWTPYTPSWTSTGTAPAIGNGTLTGAYVQIGKWVQFRIQVTFGSTTTFGTGGLQVSLPVTPVGTVQQFANVGVMDRTVGTTGGVRHQIMGRIAPSATTMPLYFNNSSASPGTASINNLSNTVPVALTNSSATNSGDYIAITGSYEAA